MAEEPYTRIYARIDLDAIVKNMEAMRENLPAKTKMIGVVKTDGYGHGNQISYNLVAEHFYIGVSVTISSQTVISQLHIIGIAQFTRLLISVFDQLIINFIQFLRMLLKKGGAFFPSFFSYGSI